MSEHEMMIPKRDPERDEEDQIYDPVIINAYQPDHINELVVQDSIRQFYKTLDFPCCGDYFEPSLQPIADKKKQMHKDFVEGKQMQELHKTSFYDGLYDNIHTQQQSANELIRLKTRLVRDKRQQYFQQNSQFVIDNQFFHEHLSRLANISFDQNQAIRTFQKNAILSERNNQKKNMPFQLQINIGCIWITKHELQNEQQRKFETLRPLLKQFSNLSVYPVLSQLSKQIKYLLKVKEHLIQTNSPIEQVEQTVKKIDITTNQYNKQVEKTEKLMKQILQKWRQVKQIRKSSNMETVPWKLNVKQYEIEGQRSFDIGITPTQINDKPSGPSSEDQVRRRINIRSQIYFLRIYINGYEVAKSQKFYLQWPSFRVPINQKFNVTVYSAPSSIQVEIIKVGIINKVIDTINLHLPGQFSKTITASQRRFASSSFSSNGNKVRKGQEQALQPSGVIIYRIEWKGQGSRMPPVSFKAQQQQTAPTQKSEQQQIDYQLYDIKDPRVHHKSKKQEVQQQIIKAHGALLPFIDTQSARHLLLKMKATQPQFEKLQVPLTQQQIRKRPDLLNVIDNQKQKILQNVQSNEQIYNPIQGIFKSQHEDIIKQIKQILYKIQNLKMNLLRGTSSKYKICEEIVNQYIFQQMESPIVVFFKNLFTQKRKLGPKITYLLQARNVIDNMEVNIHLRAARNVPIRQAAFAKIRHFQQEFRKNPFQQMLAHTGNMEMYSNYGASFYQRPPNMNIQGQNFFVHGIGNLNMGRPNFEANYKMPALQRNNSYIQMRFKKLLKRTQCFEGPYPQWNQTLQFDYNLKNQQMTIPKLYANNEKMIKLYLFDMVEESKPTTTIAEARIKKTKYYLGRIDIPMSMMVCIPTLSGMFAVQRPLILFGYGIKKTGLFQNQADPQYANRTVFPEVQTLMNLNMFTDPLIDSIHAYNSDRKFVTGAQSTLLLQMASDWLSNLNTSLYIRLWLNNIEGRSIFICRFLADNIMPPPNFERSIQRCARFVSLIPKKYTCKLLQNTEEFHLTCDQFLNVKMGEDHGILLCNYFNYIDKKQGRHHIVSYLALGKAFPYGKSMFVLRKDTNTGNCELWDPYTGNSYFLPCIEYDTICCFFKYQKKIQVDNQKDICNMLELTSIVTPTNVYINLQQTLKPNQIDFNFDDDKLWKPFLTQSMKNEHFERSLIESIQLDITDEFYDRPKQIQVKMNEYEKQVFKFIRQNMKSEREKHFNPHTFKINQNISDLIRNKLLVDCETFKMDFRLTGQESTLYMDYERSKTRYSEALEKLQQDKNTIKDRVDSDKTLFGFTLNMPFTSVKQIWEKVQQTQVHLDETNNIQFVLSIRFFEMACHIFSVWIFVGSIS